HLYLTSIYTLSLHDALPISGRWPDEHSSRHGRSVECRWQNGNDGIGLRHQRRQQLWLGLARERAILRFTAGHQQRQDIWRTANLDRKSTRLNSSHVAISYAV